MKNTCTMVSIITTLLLTWLLTGFVTFLCSDWTFRESLLKCGVIVFMFLIGWIPAVIVGEDIYNKLY